ncbi:HEAT repeat protein [Teladorsagia circumcincta]|uniref:HEAT repeat protein n=1 Tax=Teladorsagia circumcincta TaxID=45464 RepID=A0A2G9UKP3_TELCI|nr:HEAT repeat protein [Teladorsagia circumcincta]
MDEWDLLDEVDVIALWPNEHKKNVESAKWQERKEALETIAHDSNINVVIAALQVVAKLANGLRDRFGCFVSMIWVPILDKSKDKKVTVRTAVGQALDAISDVCATDRLTKDLCEHLSKPNPQSKQCLCGFLTRYFVRQNSPQLEFAKTVLPIVVKLASDSDPSVRDAACSTLGSARRLLGKGLDAFLAPIITEKAKLDKAEEVGTSASAHPEDVDPWTLMDVTNVVEKMRKDFDELVMPIAFDKLKEKKAVLRNELIELCDSAATTTSLENYTEAVCGGLSKPNPQSRAQTALFVARLLSRHDSVTVPVNAVKMITPDLVKITENLEKIREEFGDKAAPEIIRLHGAEHKPKPLQATSAPAKVPSASVETRRVPPASRAPVRPPGSAARPSTAVSRITNRMATQSSVAPTNRVPARPTTAPKRPNVVTATAARLNTPVRAPLSTRPAQSATPRPFSGVTNPTAVPRSEQFHDWCTDCCAGNWIPGRSSEISN